MPSLRFSGLDLAGWRHLATTSLASLFGLANSNLIGPSLNSRRAIDAFVVSDSVSDLTSSVSSSMLSSSTELRRLDVGDLLAWFKVSLSALRMGLLGVGRLRGDVRNGPRRRRLGLLFFVVAGVSCSGEKGKSSGAWWSFFEFGLKALVRANGESGDWGEPEGEVLCKVKREALEGDRERERLICLIDGNPSTRYECGWVGEWRCRVPPTSRWEE